MIKLTVFKIGQAQDTDEVPATKTQFIHQTLKGALPLAANEKIE